MSTETQIKLKFISVDFPVVNFNSEKQFLGDDEIHIDIEPKVYLPKDDHKHFKIIQEVNIFVKETFKIFIIAIGNFELNDIEDEQLRKSFINLNAPAIMFPYIRSFISTLTANLGDVTGTLNIPPQFFKGELPIVTEDDLAEEK
jgi:preprotein translocase subunit SecB